MKHLVTLFFTAFTFFASGQNCLEMYYTFEGNANDQTTNGNNGTVNGPVLTSGQHSVANGAYAFDGVDDYIVIPAPTHDFGNTATFTARFQADPSAAGHLQIFDSRDSAFSSASIHAWLDVDNNQLEVGGFGSSQQFSYNFSGGGWHCVGIVYNDTTDEVTCYGDGMLLSQVSGSITNKVYMGADLKIGTRADFIGSGFFNGVIDDFRVYDCILSQQEVTNTCNDDTTVGLAEHDLYDFNVYPNPSSGQFSISTSLRDYQVQLFNAQGQEVAFSRNGSSITVTNKIPGMYLLSIIQEGRRLYSTRLMVE